MIEFFDLIYHLFHSFEAGFFMPKNITLIFGLYYKLVYLANKNQQSCKPKNK